MKINKFLLGMFACATVCACSNDDSDVTGNQVFSGDEAYMVVRLADGGTTKGYFGNTATKDSVYQYGTAKEYGVNTAHFYFYDADGVFVAEASAWNGGSANTATPDESIEFFGKSVVVLKGLKNKNFPKTMVTVVNKATDFTPATTLAELEKQMSTVSNDPIVTEASSSTFFTMSTTSYDGSQTKYFVTDVTESNFSLEPIASDQIDNISNAVTVYVERLAAKVTVNTDLESDKTVEGATLYPVKVTVAGNENDEDDNDNIGAETLYVQFLGWDLNATAKKSYIVKNIDESWTNTTTTLGSGWAWNDATNYRSYWGKSFNYGDVTSSLYPSASTGYVATDAAGYALNYVNLAGTTLNAVGSGYDYCAENTNTSAVLSTAKADGNLLSYVTHVLLKAKVCDENGNALDLVRYNGILYKKDAFMAYVINNCNANGELNAWVKSTDETTGNDKYTQIDASYISLKADGAGGVYVVLTNEAKEATLYYDTDAKDENGNPVYAELENTDELETALAAFTGNAYNGGEMYYEIPIEHFNNEDVTGEEEAENTILEAKYGIVRNHHYVITIDKLETLGKGIFDPNEIIVPDDDEELYYVGTKINILSWKLVNQNVQL